MIPTIKLNSGQEMPLLGLGTWQLDGKKCFQAVKKALELGYPLIDTAPIYGNQKEVGRAISEFERKNIFLTSKIWYTDLAGKDVEKAVEKILEELNTNYVDLLLVHWPNKSIPMQETLEAMAELVKKGKAKSIGVSNFTISHLKEALVAKKALISVNQVEFHPLLFQKELLEFCQNNGIVLNAYSPLGRGTAIRNRIIKEIAKKYKKTEARVCLRWLVQKNIVAIPKASSEDRLKENMQLFDWQLQKEDEKQIDSIKRQKRMVRPAFAEFEK